jgi:hypothetical protein
MKITKHKLQEIIKEELFYREFYREAMALTEQPNIISHRVMNITKQIEKLNPAEQMQLFDILRPMIPPPAE